QRFTMLSYSFFWSCYLDENAALRATSYHQPKQRVIWFWSSVLRAHWSHAAGVIRALGLHQGNFQVILFHPCNLHSCGACFSRSLVRRKLPGPSANVILDASALVLTKVTHRHFRWSGVTLKLILRHTNSVI